MNEKEIADLILDHCFVGKVAIFTHEYPDGCPAVRGAEAAAHAIAKKLAEGVVCEDSGIISGMSATPDTRTLCINTGMLSIQVHGMDPETVKALEGKMARVTVTKEEGDG